MLKIRLQRVGRKNHAEFRVVVTEHTRAAKKSNIVESVGHYNPHSNAVVLKDERVTYWMGVGAQPSDTVHNLLVREGKLEGKKKNVLPKKTPPAKETTSQAAEAADTKAADTDKTESIPEEGMVSENGPSETDVSPEAEVEKAKNV